MMAAHYLTHIYTSLEKRAAVTSEHVKGPLDATIRSPLMKALDRSVETLGLRIVTCQLLSVPFTVACLVAKPLNRSESEGDLAAFQMQMTFLIMQTRY